MDKPALDVIRETAKAALIAYYDDTTASLARALSEDVLTALGANGYVVVPRHILDELLDAARVLFNAPLPTVPRLVAARAAVVEAVGPAREDMK